MFTSTTNMPLDAPSRKSHMTGVEGDMGCMATARTMIWRRTMGPKIGRAARPASKPRSRSLADLGGRD